MPDSVLQIRSSLSDFTYFQRDTGPRGNPSKKALQRKKAPLFGPLCQPYERELSLSEAQHRIDLELAELGWRVEVGGALNDALSAATAVLTDRSGRKVQDGRGAGKGMPLNSRIGAIFEALEHVYSGPILTGHLDTHTIDVSKLAAGPLAHDPAIIELAAGIAADTPIACLKYCFAHIHGGSAISVTIFLWAPWFTSVAADLWRQSIGDGVDYSRIKSYSVNTGCAIGASEDEAVLHALNEWVERDALSVFLLTSIYDSTTPPRRISRQILSPSSVKLLTRAEKTIGKAIDLFDITTDIEVPAVLATVSGESDLNSPHYGLGVSISADHALERAVTEVVQAVLLAPLAAQETPPIDLSQIFRGHPQLLACARMQIPESVVDLPSTARRFSAREDPRAIKAQRHQVTKRIAAAGHDILIRRLATLHHGTTIVQVQCPGLERFHLVTNGHVTIPGQRANRLRKSFNCPGRRLRS
ncbi:YcaO-like family protein [Mycobacterium montefiorense]|uniref:YcaO-like family protein n=1 Tax=Mycobacterium montefiorense TaxID=154654 RepID=UPI000D59DF5F|nr:YcaO-like family protein [Mycobacterium montefiorense]